MATPEPTSSRPCSATTTGRSSRRSRHAASTSRPGIDPNYLITAVSLASTLNMRHLQDEAEPASLPVNDIRHVRQARHLINDNAVFAFLRGRGYGIDAVSSGFEEVALRQADRFIDTGQLSEVELLTFRHTGVGPIATVLAPDIFADQQRARIVRWFRRGRRGGREPHLIARRSPSSTCRVRTRRSCSTAAAVWSRPATYRASTRTAPSAARIPRDVRPTATPARSTTSMDGRSTSSNKILGLVDASPVYPRHVGPRVGLRLRLRRLHGFRRRRARAPILRGADPGQKRRLRGRRDLGQRVRPAVRVVLRPAVDQDLPDAVYGWRGQSIFDTVPIDRSVSNGEPRERQFPGRRR